MYGKKDSPLNLQYSLLQKFTSDMFVIVKNYKSLQKTISGKWVVK